jgi:spermidine synthase
VVSAAQRSNSPVAGEYIAETGFYQSISLTDHTPILQRKSRYQDISIYESKHYGKILMLDGVIQLTERDADSYNEMMAHPAMFSHPNPRKVLIIGGGDGYVLSEVLKHQEVEHVDHVDLDGDVIDVCRNHFGWGQAWDDPRVTLHVADGAAFVKNVTSSYYDVIIQDSSDPYTWEESSGEKIELPSNTLYSHDHFLNIHRILKDDGVFSFQAEVSSHLYIQTNTWIRW